MSQQYSGLDLHGFLSEILKDCTFDGVPVSALIKHRIVLAAWNGSLLEKREPVYKLFLRKYYYLYFDRKSPAKFNKGKSLDGKILIEILSTEDRFRNLWQPVVDKLDKEKIMLLNANGAVALPTINANDLVDPLEEGYDLKAVRRWISAFERKYAKEIKKLFSRLELPVTAYPELVNIMVMMAIRYLQIKKLLERGKPAAFLSVDDQQLNSACFCALLNKENIPTYTMVHGAIGSESMGYFAPVNASKVLTWGKYGSELFVRNGTAANRICEAGIQRLEKSVPPSVEKINEIKAKHSIPLNKKIVLLGFTRLLTDTWLRDINELATLLPDFYFIGRLHPTTDRSAVSGINKNNLVVMNSVEMELKENIYLSDFVIVDISTLGFDALFYNKPVVVLNSTGSRKNLGLLEEIIDARAAVFCSSAQMAADVLTNNNNVEALTIAGKKFAESYVAAYGESAAKNIADIITKNLASTV